MCHACIFPSQSRNDDDQTAANAIRSYDNALLYSNTNSRHLHPDIIAPYLNRRHVAARVRRSPVVTVMTYI